MKAGDRWKSKTSSLGFKVLVVDKDEILVEVERRVATKNDEIITETRKRSIPRNDFPSFSRAYQKVTK